MNKILVVVAHGDDEVLGCGGTICKHIEDGDEIYVLVVTVPSNPEWDNEFRETMIQQQKDVDNFLGITKRDNLGYSVMEMNTIPRGRFNWSINNYIHKLQPDVVYTHWYKDLNHQHRLVAEAVIAGTRLPSQCKVLMFENESSRFSLSTFRPNIYVDIKPYIDKKVQAFSLYKTELKEYPHPRSIKGIINHAEFRGVEVGIKYAEAFYLVREVVK